MVMVVGEGKEKRKGKYLLSAVLWITVDAIACAYKSTWMLGWTQMRVMKHEK